MKDDPTNWRGFNEAFTYDSQSLSPFEKHALDPRDSTGVQYFEKGLRTYTSDAGKLPQAIRAWNSFESYA